MQNIKILGNILNLIDFLILEFYNSSEKPERKDVIEAVDMRRRGDDPARAAEDAPGL